MSLQLLRMFENETSLIFETEKKFELFFRFVIEVGEPALNDLVNSQIGLGAEQIHMRMFIAVHFQNRGHRGEETAGTEY